MKRVFDLVIERDGDGWFVGSIPELPGCHTQAKTLDELKERIKEAILLYLEEQDAPSGIEFFGVDRVDIAG